MVSYVRLFLREVIHLTRNRFSLLHRSAQLLISFDAIINARTYRTNATALQVACAQKQLNTEMIRLGLCMSELFVRFVAIPYS
jgi:hypothetical protein